MERLRARVTLRYLERAPVIDKDVQLTERVTEKARRGWNACQAIVRRQGTALRARAGAIAVRRVLTSLRRRVLDLPCS